MAPKSLESISNKEDEANVLDVKRDPEKDLGDTAKLEETAKDLKKKSYSEQRGEEVREKDHPLPGTILRAGSARQRSCFQLRAKAWIRRSYSAAYWRYLREYESRRLLGSSGLHFSNRAGAT